MGSAVNQVRAYLAGVLEATRALIASIAARVRSSRDDDPQTRWVLERLLHTLHVHEEEMAEHLERLGGGSLLEAVNARSASGEPDAQRLSELLGDVNKAQISAAMLETNARALAFSSTAALARRHREELDTMIERMRELPSPSVRGEIVQERMR